MRDVLNDIAVRKVGIENWKAYNYQVVDGGYLLTGGIPRTITRGPRKGALTWDDKVEERQVIVTRAEKDKELADYELNTGNCYSCEGTKQEWWGWSKDEGHKYRDCRRCEATGKPLEVS